MIKKKIKLFYILGLVIFAGVLSYFIYNFTVGQEDSIIASDSEIKEREAQETNDVQVSDFSFPVLNLNAITNKEYGWINPKITIKNDNNFAVYDAILTVQFLNKDFVPVDQMEIAKEGSWQSQESFVFDAPTHSADLTIVENFRPSKLRFHDGKYNYSDFVVEMP